MKPDVSIIIANYNQKETIKKAIESSLKQSGFKTEVLVADDKSTQKEVFEIYKSFGKKITVVENSVKGRVPLLNKAIKACKAEFVCMSAGDCILEKDFLKKLMKFFHNNKKIAFVSPFSETGGNCTVFRKKALLEVNGFSTEYSDAKTGFRDDTDLAFKIWDKGYESVFNYAPKFKHEHRTPTTILGKLDYALSRLKIHQFDALLFKNHPERTTKFFDIKLGFLRNPLADFKTATGLWHRKKQLSLSSPQGVQMIENKSLFHFIAIILGGIVYVLAVKLVRFYSSVKFGKLLL